MPDYSCSDGWVLHALSLAGGTTGTSLERLVFVGDGINHTVFGGAELADCLGRLLSAGLVTKTDAGYAVTPDVAGRLKKGGLTCQREKADRLVLREKTETLALSALAPSEAACRSAIKSYLREANEMVGEPTRLSELGRPFTE